MRIRSGYIYASSREVCIVWTVEFDTAENLKEGEHFKHGKTMQVKGVQLLALSKEFN